MIPLVIGYQWGGERAVQAAWIVAAMFLLVLVPLAALHLRYLACNGDVTISFDDELKRVELSKNGHSKVIFLEEIDAIEVVIPRAIKNDEMPFYPWQLYGYALFTLKSGNQFVITTLLVLDLSWPFRLGREKEVVTSFCWPPKISWDWIISN